MIDLSNIEGFEWDIGNINKNLFKHSVTANESEEVFRNEPLIINYDEKHSTAYEKRFHALGKTISGRKLFNSFVVLETIKLE